MGLGVTAEWGSGSSQSGTSTGNNLLAISRHENNRCSRTFRSDCPSHLAVREFYAHPVQVPQLTGTGPSSGECAPIMRRTDTAPRNLCRIQAPYPPLSPSHSKQHDATRCVVSRGDHLMIRRLGNAEPRAASDPWSQRHAYPGSRHGREQTHVHEFAAPRATERPLLFSTIGAVSHSCFHSNPVRLGHSERMHGRKLTTG